MEIGGLPCQDRQIAATVGQSPSTAQARHLRPRDGSRQETTPTELFFDLVYVFAVTQISHLVIDAELSRASIAQAAFTPEALATAVHDGDRSALDGYSDAVLPRLWRYQEFSAWMTDTMHDAGDQALHGAVRQMMARARLDALFTSPDAARLHSAYLRGTA